MTTAQGGFVIDRRTFLLSTAAGSLGLLRASRLAQTGSASTPLATLESAKQAPSGEKLAPPGDGKVRVACVFSSNVTLIDWVGPEAVFDAWVPDESTNQDRPLFELFTVGESRALRDPGFNAIPDYTYDDAPQAQIIVVPAQAGSPRFYQWLKSASESADLTMSVCVGARHLAKLGMLDGKVATTHHDFIKSFSEEFPKVQWVSGRRFVEGPKVATSAGVTAGIDLALHVVERYFGREKAVAVTKALEYQGTGWMV
jgi:transcriptional regulator GlxA family with amidase domain